MRLDPHTQIGTLVKAVPSAMAAFRKLGIPSDLSETKTLEQACADCNVSFEQLMSAMDEIDWDEEAPRVNSFDAG